MALAWLDEDDELDCDCDSDVVVYANVLKSKDLVREKELHDRFTALYGYERALIMFREAEWHRDEHQEIE